MQNALRRNHDIFAWAHSDMKGIHPSITSHRLNVLQQHPWWYPKKKENGGFASITPISIMHVQKMLPFSTNRSDSGFHRARDALFLGCLLRISPDSHSHAIRTQKRWRHLSETDDKDLQTSDRPHGRGIY
ncbi:hypothetical protein AAG906_026152 [Vitis piasezkii]